MDIKKLQLERLKKVVKKVYNNVEHYRKAFDEREIHPDDINTLEDLKSFPLQRRMISGRTIPTACLLNPWKKS